MILEGKTYKAVKQGNGTNLISDNHVFTLSNVTQGVFDWDGKLTEISALTFGDNTATRTANTACVATFPSGGRHIISVYVKYDDLGAPDLTSPADFVFIRSGQTSVIPTNYTSLGDDIYRLWFNLDNGVGFSLTTVGIAKTTTVTFNARTFKAYGLQVEHAVNALDEPTDYTATNGTAITTPLPVKLKPILGNGIVYKPVSLLAETDAVLSRGSDEGFTLPNSKEIIDLDIFIRSLINAGIFQKLDSLLRLTQNNVSLFNFSLINLKRPFDVNCGLATAHGGVTATVNGPQTNGVDGYINTMFNPVVSGVNYQAANAGFGVVGRATNRLIVSQRTSQASIVQTLTGVAQRINAEANLIPLPDFGMTSGVAGLTYIAKTGSTTGFGLNKSVQTTGNYSIAAALVNSNFALQTYYNNPPNHAYYAGTPGLFFAGAALTYAELQAFRAIENEYLARKGLTQIA